MPIPGTTSPVHLVEDLRATEMSFAQEELAEFDRELDQIKIQGQRLREGLIGLSGVEAPKPS